MRGLFLIDRNIFERASFKAEPYTEREAWLWLISEASYKRRDVRTKKGAVHLERGQLTHSSRFMAEKWQWKEPRVRRFLNRLKIDASIDTTNDAVQNIITICNYDIYQDFEKYQDAVKNAQNDAVATQQRRSSDAKKNTRITPEETPEETPPKPPTGAARDFEKNLKSGEVAQEVIENCLRLTSLPSHNPKDIGKWTRQVRRWVDAGAIPDKHIYPVIRRMKAKTNQKIQSLGFFTDEILAEIDKKAWWEKEADEWGRRVKGFKAGHRWNTMWGMEPGEVGCMAPEQALSEHGYQFYKTVTPTH
ncbi:MAG: hypothetical protein JKY45_10415 [Emcibacter sp.]|nr:hypothetical protein [Emcibacter sp.]